MAFSYANPGSGPSAGGIGWYNFGNITMNPGDVLTGLTGTLNDGNNVTFDLSMVTASGTPRSFVAESVPTFPGSNFGTTGYTGLLGNVALNSVLQFPVTSTDFQITNIVVKDSLGNLIPNYTVVLADAERTNTGESLTYVTDGGGWTQLAALGPNPPTLTGLGSNTVNIVGNTLIDSTSFVLTTQNPKTIDITVNNGISSREAFAIGFAVTSVKIQKNIGSRIDSTDQFVLNIGGTPNNQVTTTGAANGIQPLKANVYATPGNTYSITEAMAPGSANPLTAYTVMTSAMNATLNGTVPTTGPLPLSITPKLGDNITYVILNAAPETFLKTVDKAYADLGDLLTYTVSVNNPNNFAINNVVVTDPIPMGTTFANNIIANVPFTGTNPATGITLTSISANTTATVSWKVQVSSTTIVTPINNAASIVVPNGTSGNTNIVSTVVNTADLSSMGNFNKSVDLVNAKPGDTLTYTIKVRNTGNTAANGVVITDAIPAGTTYVPGSVTSVFPITGDPTTSIALTAPLMPSTTETLTFKVKIGDSIPVINPIPNSADVKYTYTVDPANPNGVAKAGTSNTTNTQVSQASIVTAKTSDKSISYIGDTITYNIAVTNTGNVLADNVVVTDLIPTGTTYVPGSVTATAPFTGIPATGVNLTNPINPGQTVNITFKVTVVSIPNPNPFDNQATTTFQYTVDPANPNGVTGTSTSNVVSILIFRNNYTQQINDLIDSVAKEQAALAAIANQEGAKIQAAVAMNNVTEQQLLCINKSVADMLESINMLEMILKQKLGIVNCQINGCTCC